jgi:hypothetical protein
MKFYGTKSYPVNKGEGGILISRQTIGWLTLTGLL